MKIISLFFCHLENDLSAKTKKKNHKETPLNPPPPKNKKPRN